ncbi:IS1/IS1595 family N-terminal zinc-binding domain-containing protein [Microcoleus sp. S28C3]
MKCPRCDSQYIVKNGHTHNGKQSFKVIAQLGQKRERSVERAC